MFCLAVCYLPHYFTGEALVVSLSYLLSVPHYLQQQDMTNKIIKQHMQTTQTLLLISMLNAYIQNYQKLDVSW